jgi:hypothetical protein
MLKSKERRIRREKSFIGKEFNTHVSLFIDTVNDDIEKIMNSGPGHLIDEFIKRQYSIDDAISFVNEKWRRYIENVRKNPKYHVSPNDEEMFRKRANFLIVNHMLVHMGMSHLRVKYYYPDGFCEKHFVEELERILCEQFLIKEKKKISYTEIQKNVYFSAILNLVDWFVSLLKRK